MTFHCVRVYLDGSAKHTVRDAEGMESWKGYNSVARGGCALFINGEYQGPDDGSSHFNSEVIAAIEAELKALPDPGPVQQPRWIPASPGEPARHRYPDDAPILRLKAVPCL